MLSLIGTFSRVESSGVRLSMNRFAAPGTPPNVAFGISPNGFTPGLNCPAVKPILLRVLCAKASAAMSSPSFRPFAPRVNSFTSVGVMIML